MKRFDKYYSEKSLGAFIEKGKTIFRIFIPEADNVSVALFKKPDSPPFIEYKLKKDKQCVWELAIDEDYAGLFYGFYIEKKKRLTKKSERFFCIDPYAKAITTFTDYMNPRLGIIVKEDDYNWEGDAWIAIDKRDLIIYEAHIRDLTAHNTSGSSSPGTYKGLIEENIRGGLNYISSLGVNAVEILPAQEFGYMEIPFNKEFNKKLNDWNPYERNHWGYMTAGFFAPAAYYNCPWKEFQRNTWIGFDSAQIRDFKDMIKAFHQKGIAVIMDVVYNHFSEYELNGLKEISEDYYLRTDDSGKPLSHSGCGNDLRSEAPMVRKMIIDSLIHWTLEYHVDGFRFDLAKIIDWETIEIIERELKKINPDAILIAEPWGGGYDPTGFSFRNYAAWNDHFRNGIKGENPFNGLGWIFNKQFGNNSPERIKSYVKGTLTRDYNGLFYKKEHSVNYLESHDGYTLGDFIRIATGTAPETIIKNSYEHSKLTPLQLKLHKLAALFLFTSQGIVMIHSGQEFARSKVISIAANVPNPKKGTMDHNSYEKDDDTNYINYDIADLNKELLDYYKGLIKLRNENEALKRAEYKEIEFIHVSDMPFTVVYKNKYKGEEYLAAFNPYEERSFTVELGADRYRLLADEKKAGYDEFLNVRGKIEVRPTSGILLRRMMI